MANFNLDNYIPVHERIEKFYGLYPNGRINTEIIGNVNGIVVIKAAAYRERDDADPSATGHAYEKEGEGYINKTSHIENCETSAIGRALANLGIEVSRGIASREEMQKVERMTAEKPTAREGLVLSLKKIGQALNAKGDSIKWSGKQTSEYITEQFGEGVTLDNANEAQLKTVADDLQARLKTLEAV